MSEKECSISDFLKEEEKVIFASGYLATQAEVEWAKQEMANSPVGMYVSIEEVISVKRSFDELRRGKYELSSQYH